MFVSICISMPYLIAFRVMDLKYVAIIQLVLITAIGYDLYKLVCENIITDSPEELSEDIADIIEDNETDGFEDPDESEEYEDDDFEELFDEPSEEPDPDPV